VVDEVTDNQKQSGGFPVAAVLAVVALAVFGLSYVARPVDRAVAAKHNTEPFERIVSMAPSVTEMLYALGVEDRVVGVTNYCKYPAAAQEKAKIGGYYQPDYEAIMRLKPDVVLVLTEHEAEKAKLAELGIPARILDCRTVESVLMSMEQLGESCDEVDKATAVVGELRARIAAVEAAVADQSRPGVLISFGPKGSGESLSETVAVGPGTFYDDLVNLAGGRNVMGEQPLTYPFVSAENMLRLNPDVIIDLTMIPEQGTDEAPQMDWGVMDRIAAVKNKRVHKINKDYATIPGPRVVDLLEDFAGLIHPESTD
jgi:iron complex transport system substrate-binding protein